MCHRLLFIVSSYHINKQCDILYIKETLKWNHRGAFGTSNSFIKKEIQNWW